MVFLYLQTLSYNLALFSKTRLTNCIHYAHSFFLTLLPYSTMESSWAAGQSLLWHLEHLLPHPPPPPLPWVSSGPLLAPLPSPPPAMWRLPSHPQAAPEARHHHLGCGARLCPAVGLLGLAGAGTGQPRHHLMQQPCMPLPLFGHLHAIH